MAKEQLLNGLLFVCCFGYFFVKQLWECDKKWWTIQG